MFLFIIVMNVLVRFYQEIIKQLYYSSSSLVSFEPSVHIAEVGGCCKSLTIMDNEREQRRAS